ncbi:MAG TPA: hypothetical protein VF412_00710 [Bdellovibrio sp.]|uniref:hypothetical protein n=1 Tax=Bdellovibrio sp. TaxID=28201 RepID=UPI002F0337E7
MEIKVVGTQHQLFLEGPISEKTAIYEYELKGATELLINMEKVTFINSIGVKNWITWSMKIPSICKIRLEMCPFVIVNQVNIVQGFLPRQGSIESFIAPYMCETCGVEKTTVLKRGEHFQYASSEGPKFLNLPEDIFCPKCKMNMEPDFLIERVFAFLTPKV